MTVQSMTGKQSVGKGHADTNFSAAGRAREAAVKYGKDNIINATIGVMIGDENEFMTFPTVDKCYRNLSAEELMNYAPISGLPEFNKAAIEFAFRGTHLPRGCKAASVATPGGSGAIHHCIFNYVTTGDTYLIPELHWDPYHEMATEMHDTAMPYVMFDENNNFSLNDLKQKAEALFEKQESVMTIFNTPAHNPSGYSMTNDDWKEIVDFYRDYAAKGKKAVIVWDMAYTDYAGDADEVRDFLKYFDNMPENMLLLVAFSMSKSFLVYGMRSGALICVTPSQAVIDEFNLVNSFSNRATWSNGSRGAQKLLAEIIGNPGLRAATDRERAGCSAMLANRAKIFMEEAKQVGLKTLPYQAGFFIMVPTKECNALSSELQKDNIYTIPLGAGIRIAVSAVPTHQIAGLATKIKKCMDRLGIK